MPSRVTAGGPPRTRSSSSARSASIMWILARARFVLGTALLMMCPSIDFAQRLLTIVEECHVGRGIDLHHAVRGSVRQC